MAKKKSVISLYTGAGGLDFGFEKASFETRVAVEIDASCCKNLLANRNWPVLEADIHDVSSEKIMEAASLREGEADILIGGPPCQPFSKSGYWAAGDSKRLDDPRASTLESYLRVLRDTQPKTFLLENVPGLAYRGKDEGLRKLYEEIERINAECGTNYRPVSQVLNAANFGVPQMRERLFIVAARNGSDFTFPSPTHRSLNDFTTPELPPHLTTWDALGDLPQLINQPELALSGKWAELLASIPEGENYLWHTERGGGMPLFGWRRRYWNFLLKLSKDRPSWTIQAQPGSATGPFHWTNRKLSMRELCRLQTFPDDVVLSGSRTEIQRLIGNAVPSLMGEILGRAIAEQLLGGTSHRKRPSLMPPSRSNRPKPEPVAPVPEKYLELVGNHEAHPGTGKGYGASRRRA